MQVFENIFTDRGSRYAVSGAPVTDRDGVRAVLAELARDKAFRKASHNSWAVLFADGPAKGDDGEGGAGAVILQKLEGAGLTDHVVIVSRWFGGKHLGGDRFRRVAEAVEYYLQHRAR